MIKGIAINTFANEKTQRIIRWLTGDKDVELSPEEEEEWIKISFMDDMLRKYLLPSKAIHAWKEKFNKKGSSAYHCYHKTQYIIGSTHIVNKKYQRNFLNEILDKAIKLCLTNENTKDLPRLIEQKYKLLELDKQEAIDPTQIQPSTIIIDSNPEVLKISPPNKDDFEEMVESLELSEELKSKVLRDAKGLVFSNE